MIHPMIVHPKVPKRYDVAKSIYDFTTNPCLASLICFLPLFLPPTSNVMPWMVKSLLSSSSQSATGV